MQKKKKKRARPGYKQVQLRLRPELLELIDLEVKTRRDIERGHRVGEPTTSRTSLILDAINAHLRIVVPGVPGVARNVARNEVLA